MNFLQRLELFSISRSKFLNSSMEDRVLMAPQPTLAMKSTGDVELGAAGNLMGKKIKIIVFSHSFSEKFSNCFQYLGPNF